MSDRPFILWKCAASLDGRIAAADGSSKWITSAEARADGHRLRAECGAVI
jgi:diaminohydroxyphosphoribosylaminopyrimidine deaminase/5-amino-6-(5-phosphoribosylamino)uracil reductase